MHAPCHAYVFNVQLCKEHDPVIILIILKAWQVMYIVHITKVKDGPGTENPYGSM